MAIITRMLDTEVYEATTPAGHTVRMDTREPGIRKSQSPPELLQSALAGCSAVDVAIILNKRKKTIIDFVIETTGIRREETPRKFLEIHSTYIITSADVTEDELSKAVALSLEKYCSVAATLNCKISYSVKIIRP